MDDVLKQSLRGVIRRVHVGGRKGHRLIYLHPHNSNFVIPVFLSPTQKSSFEYESVDWEKLCNAIYQDYTNKNYKSFMNWNS